MATVLNIVRWSGIRSEEGHRDYEVTIRVEAATNEGPQTVTLASGLPTIGSAWTYGTDNDAWAFCTPFLKIDPVLEEENNKHWDLGYKFTTRPMFRCATTTIDNPLSEPDRISGSFVNSTKKINRDIRGQIIKTTGHETIEVEVDSNKPTVIISQNVLSLGLGTFSPLVDTVNNSTLWGLSSRKIKLSNVSWERKLYGVCNYYYTRTFEFDIDENTFDKKDIPNHGNKVIRGKWSSTGRWNRVGNPSSSNARDFIQFKDKHGENATTYLTRNGFPSSREIFLTPRKVYKESNFLTLGIPSSL